MRGFDYQNTSFNYLVLDKYVQGDEVVAYGSDTNRVVEKRKKETNKLIHDREGLLSINKSDTSTKFIITLAPLPNLNKSHIVAGEVIEGFEIFQIINNSRFRGGASLGAGEIGGMLIDDIVIISCGEKQ